VRFGTRYSLNLEQMARILRDFYGGKSLRRISQDFREDFGFPISPATIYRRVVEGVSRVDNFLSHHLKRDKNFRVMVGDIWEADGTFPRKDMSLIIVRDLGTTFTLGSSFSKSENQKSAKQAFREAKQIARKCAKILRVDGNPALYNTARKFFKNETQIEIKKKIGRMGLNTSIEGFNNILKGRIRSMHGVHSWEASTIIIRGLIIDYNFVRQSEAIGRKTPAETSRLGL